VGSLKATCDAVGAPFDAEIPIDRRVAADGGDAARGSERAEASVRSSEEPPGAEAGPRIPQLAVDGIAEVPWLDERLRRWSYSALDVHAASGPVPLALEEAEEIDAGFDAGPLAEDAQDELEVRSIGRHLFGGHVGSVAGTAIHDVFEHVVGSVTSTETERLREEVVAGFARAGLDLDRPGEVTEQFARILSFGLGEVFDHGSLDDLAGGNRTACEMDFTLPLLGEGAPSDQLVELGRLVVELDPDGPFSDFFSSLASGEPKFAQLFQGFLVGSIDLVAQVGDEPRFVILDYKNNLLSEAPSYEPGGLKVEMGRSGYPLQALLYSVALHRLLAKRLEGYDPAVHLGGACYLYVRGPADLGASPLDGVVTWRFTPEIIAGVSDLLAGRRVAS
jgi:exodeoxyribonuclease V beta subunit